MWAISVSPHAGLYGQGVPALGPATLEWVFYAVGDDLALRAFVWERIAAALNLRPDCGEGRGPDGSL